MLVIWFAYLFFIPFLHSDRLQLKIHIHFTTVHLLKHQDGALCQGQAQDKHIHSLEHTNFTGVKF